MDRKFKRQTIAAIFAAAVGIYALWWSGSTNGADDTCSMLGIQSTPYCADNAHAHVWWLLLAVASLGYLGYYLTRVRKVILLLLPEDR